MDLSHCPQFFELLLSSHLRLVGTALCEPQRDPHWLYEQAPFALLAHDTQPDPCFIYANVSAQRCFGYRWEELVGLPSRLSAEAPQRAERQRLLEAVAREGCIRDYRGVRIAKSGHRFLIEGATVWQLIDTAGRLHGQAAAFRPPG